MGHRIQSLKQILIVKTSSLGDIVHAFSVLQYLKQRVKDVQIDWVVEEPFASLVQAHPFIRKGLIVRTKKWRTAWLSKETWKEMGDFRRQLRQGVYDLVFDLQGNIKSGIVTRCAQAAIKVGFDRQSVPEWPNLLATNQRYHLPRGLNIREEYLFLVQSLFEDFGPISDQKIELRLTSQEQEQLDSLLPILHHGEGLKVIVCPGSNWPNKQLSPDALKQFIQIFSKRLKSQFFFIWGHAKEKSLVEQLSAHLPGSVVVDKLSLPTLQRFMSASDLVIAMDSLPLHLAGMGTVPTYSVFGASSAHKYRPLGSQHGSFQGHCPYDERFEKRCRLLRTCQTGACIKQLEGQLLFDHFFQWWQSYPS